MKNTKKRANELKLTDQELENMISILDNLSVSIQEFTVKAINTEHSYNGQKFSHKDRKVVSG